MAEARARRGPDSILRQTRLEPGPYVILVEAHSGGADSPAVSRRIPIRIRWR